MRRTSSQVAAERELVAKIETALDTNVVAVERAMLILYKSQTSDERESETTREHNMVGFAANDATVGSRIVKNVILRATSAGIPPGRRLWGKSLEISRRIAKRYAGTQLLAAANTKMNRPIEPKEEETMNQNQEEVDVQRTTAVASKELVKQLQARAALRQRLRDGLTGVVVETQMRSETEASKALDRMSNGFRMNPQSAQDEACLTQRALPSTRTTRTSSSSGRSGSNATTLRSCPGFAPVADLGYREGSKSAR